MGWKDLSCQGSGFYRTPHIDRLAASGMRFTNGYSACTVCSPTRAAMMTGQYPARLHVTDWIPGHERPFAKLAIPPWQKHLPLEAVTVAERLQAAGYATASIGKWQPPQLVVQEVWQVKQAISLSLWARFFGFTPGPQAICLPLSAKGPEKGAIRPILIGSSAKAGNAVINAPATAVSSSTRRFMKVSKG